jgi:nicotinamide-nucleotide amidase
MNAAKKPEVEKQEADRRPAYQLIEKLRKLHLHLATAESCSGGLLAAAVTDIPGASDVFDCGVISYSNEMKINVLNVDGDIIKAYGAVSRETAQAMATGVKFLAHADLALATTGIAGPSGGTPDKPLGLVYIALGDKTDCLVEEYHFLGNRAEIRQQTVACALKMLDTYLNTIK